MPLKTKNKNIKALEKAAAWQLWLLRGRISRPDWLDVGDGVYGESETGPGLREHSCLRRGSGQVLWWEVTPAPALRMLSEGGRATSCFNLGWGRGTFFCLGAPGKVYQTGYSSWVSQVHHQNSVDILGLLYKNSVEVMWGFNWNTLYLIRVSDNRI